MTTKQNEQAPMGNRPRLNGQHSPARSGDDTRFISAAALAARWGMSRTGAIHVTTRAGIPSYYLGGVARGTRRFLLADIQAYEQSARSSVPGQA